MKILMFLTDVVLTAATVGALVEAFVGASTWEETILWMLVAIFAAILVVSVQLINLQYVVHTAREDCLTAKEARE